MSEEQYELAPGRRGKRRRRRRRRDGPSRGLYLLPHLITTANLALGFFAIVQSFAGRHDLAALGIVLAVIADTIDGRLARLTGSSSRFGVEYTPIVGGVPSLFQGGAAFPGNDWTASPGGEDYLSRIPPAAQRALGRLRAFHLRATQKVLRRIEQGRRDVVEFACH